MTSMHFYGWKKGLKTGMYYLRSRPAADAIKFTVDASAIKAEKKIEDAVTSSAAAAANTKATGSIMPPTPIVSKTIAAATMQTVTGKVADMSVKPSSADDDAVPSSSPVRSSQPGGMVGFEDLAGGSEVLLEEGQTEEEMKAKLKEQAKLMCSIENKEACLMCSG